MSKFFFAIAEREIYRKLLTLGSGTFYLHMLAAVPSVDAETVQELTLANPTPTILTGLLYTPNQIWDFADPVFANPTNFSVPVVGVVVCKMLGSVPAMTDRLVCFSSVAIPAGNFSLPYKFPVGGLMKFGTLPISILDLQFNEPDGSTTFADAANHRFKRFGAPVVANNQSAVFDGSGMLIASNVLDRVIELDLDSVVTIPATGNDNFANATILTGRAVRSIGTNVGATSEVGEPDQVSIYPVTATSLNSVWWSWTAPSTGIFIVDTYGSELVDTTLAVYTGTRVDALTLVVYNDNIRVGTDYYHSKVSVHAISGTTYYIVVDGQTSTTGGIVLNINPYVKTEWDFNSDDEFQNLTLSIRFKLDSVGVTYSGSQYLFDSRNENYASNSRASHFAVRYDYDPTKPNDSYLAFEVYNFQSDVGSSFARYYQIPLVPIAGTAYQVDYVVWSPFKDFLETTLFIDGGHFTHGYDTLDWHLDRFAIGGSLHTNDTYPNIGDYPGYLHGSIDFIKILLGAQNPVTLFAHSLTKVLDLPFRIDFKDVAAWDNTVLPFGNVSLNSEGGADFADGYLQIQTNKTTFPNDFDWRITLEIIVQPNQAQDVIIFARLPKEGFEELNSSFFGPCMSLIVNPKVEINQSNTAGKLMLLQHIYVSKNKYKDVRPFSIKSKDRIDDGRLHKIVIQRTSGCKNNAYSTVISGQPPGYRGDEGDCVLSLYVDNILCDRAYGANALQINEQSYLENQPLYLGGLPPEITPANLNNNSNNRFVGSIKYFCFENCLPSVPKFFELEFEERNGSTAPLDLAAHTFVNTGAVTINNKKAVFDGSNYLTASPVADEWNIDSSISDREYTISVKWEFDSFSSPLFYQYVFDSRNVSGTSNIVSLSYHHDSVPASSYLEVSIDNYAAAIQIPTHAAIGVEYRVDILLWSKAGKRYSCVFFNGAYYQDNLLAGANFNWSIDRMMIGGSLATSNTYPNVGDYTGRLQGKISRIKWVHGAFDPITRFASSLTTVLDLEFEIDFQDTSAYAHPITVVGNSIVDKRVAVFNQANGGGYLTVAANNVFNFNSEWRLDTYTTDMSYPTNIDAPIICRPELDSNNGGGFILTYCDPAYPGYLVFRNQFSVNTTTSQYTTGAPGERPILMSKQILSNRGILPAISIIRTTGILNRNPYQALWMFINGSLQDVSFTSQVITSSNTPIYIGSLPPGLTRADGFSIGNGKFNGRISYVRFYNAI